MLCFALMPNHFHLLLKQTTKDGISRFMQRVSNAYVKYFNKKHKRVGGLFQGKFKAALIETDEYLLHLSRYIHQNPLELGPFGKEDLFSWLTRYQYSSYPGYLESKKTPWISKQIVLDYFEGNKKSMGEKIHSYRLFVESYTKEPEKILGELTFE